MWSAFELTSTTWFSGRKCIHHRPRRGLLHILAVTSTFPSASWFDSPVVIRVCPTFYFLLKKKRKTRQSHRWEPNSLYFVQSKQSKRKTPQSCSWIKPWASHVPTSPSVTRLNERNQQTTKLKCPCLLCFSYRRRNKSSSSGKENRTSPIHLRGSHSSTLPQWRRCKTR